MMRIRVGPELPVAAAEGPGDGLSWPAHGKHVRQRATCKSFASMASSSSSGRRVAGVAIVFVFHIGPKRGMQQTCWLDRHHGALGAIDVCHA